MKELRRKLWRFNSGAYLREKLRDDFESVIFLLEERGRATLRELGRVAEGSTNESCIAREFEGAIGDARRETKLTRFRSALDVLQIAEERMETIEEIHMAFQQIEESERKLAEIESLVGYKEFATLEDPHILLLRAREYCQSGKYRAARFIATVCAKELTGLMRAAPAGESVPSSLLERRERRLEIARVLEQQEIGVRDQTRIREAILGIDRAIERRHFAFAAALLSDQETADASIDAFLAQLRLMSAPHPSVALLVGMERKIDWRGAAAQLADATLTQASERLARHALTTSNGV
jgi:hypothetical protein